MPATPVIIAADLMQISVPFLTLVAYLPQWMRLVKTKSSEDFSLHAWALWAVSTGFGMFYAIVQLQVNGQGWPLVIAATASFLFIVFTVGLVAYYKQRHKLTGGIAMPVSAQSPG